MSNFATISRLRRLHDEASKMGLALLLVAALLQGQYEARAQVTGSCEPAEAEAYLDVNNVRARIFNNGNLFWRGSPHVYEVPKGGGAHAIFTSGIWIGGLVQDELRVAAARYYNYNFWPGPLDSKGYPPKDCTIYDRIYEITLDDIIAYDESGEISDNLRDWPWHLGAPVIDGDKNPDNYNLEGGDRPALIGDQMLWWVMNDAGNEHLASSADTPPIGLEVHASAFAFNRNPRSPFANTTFYRYILHYKGQHPFEKVYFGPFFDGDLGNFSDDYLGSDSLLHLAYTYNADNDDEGRGGYGPAPPALGYTFLRTSTQADGQDNNYNGLIDEIGEMQGMTSFIYYNGGGGVTEDPGRASDYYNYLQARWKNGRHVTLGGNGYDFSDIPTRFMFSGDPVTRSFWSENNMDGTGNEHSPGDRRCIQGTGPFTMLPGETQEMLFAIVWSRGEDHLDSVRQLKQDVKAIRRAAPLVLTPHPITANPVSPVPNRLLGVAQNYPNPFSHNTTIRYALPHSMHVRLTVYDVLGREVVTLVDERQEPQVYEVPFDGSTLPDGVYFYRIEMDHLSTTHSMLLVR